MLSFHAHLKVFLATAPCDLRMNFNGLWAAAQERLGEDPKGGALFVFGNRRRQQTTFDIPIRHRCHRIQMASVAWSTTAVDAAHGA
jgi:transposase